MAGHTWLRPIDLGPNAAGAWPALSGTLEHEYDARWFVIRGANLRSGDDLTVTLKLNGGTADLTLLGFTDIRAAALKIVAQLQSAAGLLDADDMDSDDMDSDDMDSDDMDSDDMDSDDMDSDDMDSDDMDSDDMDSNDMAVDLGIAPGVDWQGAEHDAFADVYASAQRHALRSASVTPGPADERIHTVVRAGGQDLYFRVRGHHGAFDPTQDFTISATVTTSTACANVDTCPQWSPIPGDVLGGKHETLILTNTARASLALADERARRAFLKGLTELAIMADGVVYDLRDNAALGGLYRTWDVDGRACVPFANAIVESVRQIVAQFAACNPLRYVVLAGGDDVIPFGRIEDRAEISREWQWAGPYDPDTPLGAALTYGFYLSDDVYGRIAGPIDLRGKNVRTPTFATGRLVETASDITAYLERISARGCLGCVTAFLPFGRRGLRNITLDSALVSGYDFVSDLATEIARQLEGAGAQVTRVITPPPPLWTAPDLASELRKRPRLIAAQGHYSAHTLVPAAQDTARLLPTDPVIANADLTGRLWMTIGCHSGHNVIDREARAAYPYAKSWAEALLARGATLIGGTGYQYGESVLLANSEKLYTLLTEELIRSSEVALGDALIAAKRRYLEQKMPVRGIDQKLLEVATLYGLPMLTAKVKTPVAPSDPVTVAPEPVAERDGLRARTMVLESGLTSAHLLVDDAIEYFKTHPAIVRPLRPVLPGIFRDITAADQSPVGVLWTDGAYNEAASAALIAVPVLERDISPAKRPRYRNRAFLPTRPFRLVRGVGTRHTFAFAPMQYRYDAALAAGGVRRIWEKATVTVYYARGTDPNMAFDAPVLRSPQIAASGDVSVVVRHFASAAEPVRVFASYLDGARLRTVELQGVGASALDGLGFTRLFRGQLTGFTALAPELRRVFFQAVGGNGRVSSLTNGGRLFGIGRAPAVATTIELGPPDAVFYRDRIPVRARLTDAASGAVIADADVLVRLGGSRVWVTTDAHGVASTTLNVAGRPRDGSTYLLTASFPGDDTHQGAAASRDVKIQKAPTTWRLTSAGTKVALGASARVAVATLVLARSPDRTLGQRAVMIKGKQDRIVYTDADGVLRLEPSEIAEKGPATLLFPEDDRYLETSTTVELHW